MAVTLFAWIFVLLVVVGVGIGAWSLGRSRETGGRGHDILAERLARGDISIEEYGDRLALLPQALSRRTTLLVLASVLIVVGLVGAVVASAISTRRNGIFGMMGDADGMMDGMGGMMGGESRRSGDEPAAGSPELSIKGREFEFDPDEIRVPRAQTVNIAFENRGMMVHTFTVPALDFDLRATPGDEIAGAFRATKAGRYRALCTVRGHAASGMTANVIVEDEGGQDQRS